MGWQIMLNNAGVPFTTASVPPCGLPSADSLQHVCFDDKNGFFDLGAADGTDGGLDEPLLRLKLIHEEGTARGLLGVSFHHVLCDISGIGMMLRWLHAELETTEPKPNVEPSHNRSGAQEIFASVEQVSEKGSEDFQSRWPLSNRALERWCFLARRLRAGLRGRPDGVSTVCLSFPESTLAELKKDAEEGGTSGASAFDVLVCYMGMMLLRLGRQGHRTLITKDYRAALSAVSGDKDYMNLFANVVTHGLSFELPLVNDTLEIPLADACTRMRHSIDGASLSFIRWHSQQNHFCGLPNFFGGLCCNSWGHALTEIGFIEAYAIGMRSVDERATNMAFPLDTAYMQILPQPSGSHMVILTMPIAELTTLLKQLPATHFNVPLPSEIRTHAFKVPLPSSIVEVLCPTVETHHKTVRVACVGDSLTFCGYPKFLQAMFDSANISVQIRNFGVAGATALRFADQPYWDERKLEDAKLWRPHFVVALFGTNDSKSSNWDASSFMKDYTDLCIEFLDRHPRPITYLVVPPPLYEDDVDDIQQQVVNSELPGMIPKIATAAERKIMDPIEADCRKWRREVPDDFKVHCGVIDAFSTLGGPDLLRRSYFADDGVHPNERGTRLLALTVFAQLRHEVKRCLRRWADAPQAVGDGGLMG